MSAISYQRVRPDAKETIERIADWYQREWNIKTETTINRLSGFPFNDVPFQIIMTVDGLPIATGGLYEHVGILDREPRLRNFGPWLALIYTTKENRNQGYGALLCEKIQELSKSMGVKEIFLFTHTAEKLYKRLGWEEMERIPHEGKHIVIMKKKL